MNRRHPLAAFLPAAVVLVSACDDAEDARVAADGFTAQVSGAVTGQVAGPGVVRFLPPRASAAGERPGYFFVADDSGVRELGVTFTVPAGTRPGTYRLVSAPPLDAGKEFEVRVDRSVGDRTESFQSNTEGTITIEAFPDDDDVTGRRVTGRFRFSTQDGEGREIAVEGSFDFHGG